MLGIALTAEGGLRILLSRGICPDTFIDPSNAMIWRAITETTPAKSSVADIVRVQEYLREHRRPDLADQIHGIIDVAPIGSSQAPWYASKLIEHGTRRELIDLGRRLIYDADVGTTATAPLVESMILSLERLRVSEAGSEMPMVNALDMLADEPPPAEQVFRDFWDVGDKLALIGPSKVRKSFFVLTMAFSIATGIPFAGLLPGRCRRVLYVNLEIRGAHMHRRARRMAANMGLPMDRLDDRLTFVNVRDRVGAAIGIHELRSLVDRVQAEVLILDPLYKLHIGDENSAADMKPIMRAFDALTESTGVAVCYVHHDAKGSAGDRSARDRGAGSNVLGRDYDAALILSPHRVEADAIVVEHITRNYAPRADVVMEWKQGCFVKAEDLAPEKETSASRNSGAGRSGGPGDDLALTIASEKPSPTRLLISRLRDAGFSVRNAEASIDKLVASGRLQRRSVGFPRQVIIGTPEAMRDISTASPSSVVES